MPKKFRVLIVEDKDDERRSARNELARYKVCSANDVEEPDGSFRPAQTYVEARSLIEKFAPEIRLVLLDLKIPFEENDATQEDKHGGELLKLIHELNRREDVQMRVIVVSGEAAAKGWSGENLLVRFKDTVTGIAEKGKPNSLVEQFQRLDKDPLRNRLLDLSKDLVECYDTVYDATQGIKERLKSARKLGIQLLRNELDVFEDTLGAGETHGGDLAALIGQISDRFEEQVKKRRDGTEFKKRFIEAAKIENGTWASFLWRGSLIQHLYCLNNYRNDYEHIDDKPFRCIGGHQNRWEIPMDTLQSMERGERLGQVLELIICDLLDWYLPWHEQVYLPWKEKKTAGGATS